MAAYQAALDMGADGFELDLVPTADGVLVARHDSELSTTTDVATRPELRSRRTIKMIDGRPLAGWFVEDLTHAELRTLRARERHPLARPASAAYDGTQGVPTLEDVLGLVRAESVRRGRRVELMLELKHASYYDALGLPLDELVLDVLRRYHLDHPASGVSVMSFETTVLRRLSRRTTVSLVQLLDRPDRHPVDLVLAGDRRSYADLMTPAGLSWIDGYAEAIGPHKEVVVPRDRAGASLTPSALVHEAHLRRLAVHVWTLRAENRFLATELRSGTEPDAPGDLAAEARILAAAGVDGLITDHPDVLVGADVGGTRPVTRPARLPA
ncbi:glycerophosphodiester phosphodiesterase [Myroides odoratimimus subsp. xuanwuensis]